MAEYNKKLPGKSSEDIICYNCLRKIDISDLEEGTSFKCKNCYTTLIVADYFRVVREKMLAGRNRWGIIGLILGLSPMLLIMDIVTVNPVFFVGLFTLINIIIILNLYYFRKRANDIMLGIIFAELGIYANITSFVLKFYTVAPYSRNLPNLSLHIYFFLISGSLLIFVGLWGRKRFIVR
jgi:hypothetical protein